MYRHTVLPGETLTTIAANYRRSLPSILQANPSINPNRIYPGQMIIIPNLPDPANIPYSIHISVNSRTLTLYYNGRVMRTFPIAVGQMVTATPIGSFVIVDREPNPGGPFGTMWLSLSKLHYGIHGTNDPSSIGHAVSHGCIRMHNADVEELAKLVPNGTSVTISP
ncbi:L,D-transpeptidase family protein [Geomicrobium sp. JCM 19038]|uniref:L,D-transpeptidase family protein n=1 Tax=Geomicrobium sp. JCM 19038 TaxID=1460635 RepID=UPI00045F35D0|nr:L,D-transpeptidase family protein [Geomicrobium sp. JCM 19038]GAK08225.1 ErfK/SrfK protein precursor [Geomicrobium sp. JCM 19038]